MNCSSSFFLSKISRLRNYLNILLHAMVPLFSINGKKIKFCHGKTGKGSMATLLLLPYLSAKICDWISLVFSKLWSPYMGKHSTIGISTCYTCTDHTGLVLIKMFYHIQSLSEVFLGLLTETQCSVTSSFALQHRRASILRKERNL